MPITRQQRLIHRAFLRRADQYERRYARRFLSVLARQYREAAEAYPAPYTVNPDDYRRPLILLYSTVLPSEAKVAWDMYTDPLLRSKKSLEQKDFFDDLVSILGFNVPEGEYVRIWRDVSREWLSLNILTKIQSIASTTQRAIAKVIETALEEGLGASEIGRRIRGESNGTINRHRSLLIARTETISASNKGQRLGIFTSPFEFEQHWNASSDKRTRLSHRAISQEDWRDLNQPYWLVNNSGSLEQLDYPGDPKGSPENIIQCRCSVDYRVKRDSNGVPIRKRNSPVTVSEGMEVIG